MKRDRGEMTHRYRSVNFCKGREEFDGWLRNGAADVVILPLTYSHIELYA